MATSAHADSEKQAAVLRYWLSKSGQRPLTVGLVEGYDTATVYGQIPTAVIDVLEIYAPSRTAQHASCLQTLTVLKGRPNFFHKISFSHATSSPCRALWLRYYGYLASNPNQTPLCCTLEVLDLIVEKIPEDDLVTDLAEHILLMNSKPHSTIDDNGGDEEQCLVPNLETFSCNTTLNAHTLIGFLSYRWYGALEPDSGVVQLRSAAFTSFSSRKSGLTSDDDVETLRRGYF
ncbi:hypothetical protein BDN70DRAFT_928251 [Pholiota conissans]|uniref:Uncharacterized protein n=1 Tax=Pholiota conissans TaxID=109636 RepID=A0A9P6CYX9_9AGAR|nr:hypothetical protein BDN70DRAFT_928251 [Pholiota conissans]